MRGGGGDADNFRSRRAEQPDYMSAVHQLAQAGWTFKEVAGDGNCFYRGLAYLLTGSDGNHQAAREAVARQFKSGHVYHRRLGFEQADLDELSMKMLWSARGKTSLTLG